jgi:hypothetical protein
MKSHASKDKVFGNTKFGFGKYKDHTLYEVIDLDPGYCKWICENNTSNVRDILKIVNYLKNVRIENESSKVFEKKRRDSLKKAWYENSEHMGKSGEQLNLTARVNKMWKSEAKWGTQCIIVLETVVGNHIKIKSRSADAFKMDEEEWYEFTGQVCGHEVFKSIKQTIMNRVIIKNHLDHYASEHLERERQQNIDKVFSLIKEM